MTRKRFAYDRTLRPPAPVVPVWIASPLREDGVALNALLDTGADCSLIPARIARQLRLPLVGRIRVAGVTGHAREVNVHAARVELSAFSVLAPLAAFGNEMIVGRDLLNRWRVALDGPRTITTFR